MDVALATCAALPGLYGDDRLLLPALEARGILAQPMVWEDRYADWARARLCVIRSVWDYAFRPAEFAAWAERVAALTPLANSLSVVRWNIAKTYLLDLESKKVPVVPTVLLPAGAGSELRAVVQEHGWGDVVLKPVIGCAGRLALQVRADAMEIGQAHLDRVLPNEAMLVQPLLSTIAKWGELSVISIDGQITHAVRKRAVGADFRVHSDYGGTEDLEEPGPLECSVAERAVAAVGEPVLYARVDLVYDAAGKPCVMEFELIEPELFFRFSEGAVERMADAIARRLG